MNDDVCMYIGERSKARGERRKEKEVRNEEMMIRLIDSFSHYY